MAYIGKSIESGTFSVLDTSGNTYNGSNVTFSLGTQVGSPAQLLVSHDGVIQKPGTDYSLATGGTQITFSTAPASGASIFIVEISGAVGGPLDADLNGTELILDADGDTSITADTDDQIDFKIAGADDLKMTANAINVLSGTTLTIDSGATITNSGTANGFGALAGIDDQSSSNDDQLTITDTAVVINEDSDDVDFRVESNGNANMLFVSGGNNVVGIGAEGDLGVGLHIKSGDSGASVDSASDELVIEGSGSSGMTILAATNGESGIKFGNSSDNDAGRVVYDHATDNFLFLTGGSTRMTIRDNGQIDIGAGIDSSSGFTLQVDNNEPNCGQFVGDMSDGGSAPFTFSRLAHDGTIFIFKSPSGDTGSIGVSGGTVSYNTFTGSHYCEPPSDAVPAYGELVSFTGTNKYLNDVYPPTDKWRQAEADQGKCSQSDVGNVRPLSFYGGAGTGEIIYGVEKTATANDRKVLGGYFLTQPDKPDLAAAVGNYDIWVVDKGANIAVGDWLISSDVAGHAMRDDGTTYSTAYVFAMATENVDWSTVTDTVSGTSTKKKKISVLFERFVRN